MWIAKDKDGALYLYENKPSYQEDWEVWQAKGGDFIEIPKDNTLYEELENYKYSDEPVEVEIKIKTNGTDI